MTDHPDYKYRPRKRVHPKRTGVRPPRKVSPSTTMCLQLAQQQQRQRFDVQLPSTPDTTPSSSPQLSSTPASDGPAVSLCGETTATTSVTDGGSSAPVFAGLPTPENSPLTVQAVSGGNVFDFSSTSLWSGVLRHADDATAVSELAAQLRLAVDAAAAAVSAPTLRDLVCTNCSIIHPFPVTPQLDVAATPPTFHLCQPTYDSRSEPSVISVCHQVSSLPFPPSSSDQLCGYSAATTSDLGVDGSKLVTSMMSTEDLGDVDNDELDQYLSCASTDGSDDIDLVVSEVDCSLSAVCSPSAASVVPPPLYTVKTEFSDPHFVQFPDHIPPSIVGVAGYRSSTLVETSDCHKLTASFDAEVNNIVNCNFQTGRLICSPEVGVIHVCDSSSMSRSESLDSMIPSRDVLRPLIADSANQLSSPFDGDGTYYPIWPSRVALLSSFPTANDPAEQLTDGFYLPPSTTVKQELSQDVEMSWTAGDNMSDCDFCGTTLNCKDSVDDDYDGTELLEVLADVPTV